MTTNGTLPTGITTLLNTVRGAVGHIKGVHVEAYARGVLVTTRPNDTQGASRISQAHAALRVSDVPLSHITRQAPTVLKITGPKRRGKPTPV